MNTLSLTTILSIIVFTLSVLNGTTIGADENAKPNILFITVDDMNCDSVGAFGCQLEGTTPNIDRLAAEGLRYNFAHVQVGNCMPSRNVMFSGLYPHNNRMEGFYQVKDPDYPVLADLMKEAGYFVAIRGKVSHSTPYQPYAWDADLTEIDGKKADTKNVQSYFESTKRGIEMAKAANKPFCLNINISDPHKPFYGLTGKGEPFDDPNVPSRVYRPDEVPIPGFLFDDPDVRVELAHYYSSVRRADDCFGAIMKALKESGTEDDTVVMFLSDHGMPLPFAKTALYHHSTRTPWIVRWPGVTIANSVDNEHMISAVDLLPTLLEIAGGEIPERQDGKSFLPTIRGEKQADRDVVFKVYNENSGGNRHPMRGVQTKRFLYLFNPWSDGENVFKTATTGTATYRKMKQLAKTDEKIAARLKLFENRVVEEFYDYENDPDGLHNLIDDPAYSKVIIEHRAMMFSFMAESEDHAMDVFVKRDDPAARKAYLEKVQAEADARRKKKRQGKTVTQNKKKYKNLFKVEVPKQVKVGDELPIVLKHVIPKALGKQKFHITLKDEQGKRIERKVVETSGEGELKVEFDLPGDFEGSRITVSAFVGEDYQTNLLHETVGPVAVVK